MKLGGTMVVQTSLVKPEVSLLSVKSNRKSRQLGQIPEIFVIAGKEPIVLQGSNLSRRTSHLANQVATQTVPELSDSLQTANNLVLAICCGDTPHQVRPT